MCSALQQCIKNRAQNKNISIAKLSFFSECMDMHAFMHGCVSQCMYFWSNRMQNKRSFTIAKREKERSRLTTNKQLMP